MRKFLTGFIASLLAIGYIAGVGAVFRSASPGVSGGGVLAVNPVTFALGTTFGEDSAANVLAQKNSTTAQELRVYGTTTGPKYATIKHDGTSSFYDSVGGGNLVIGQTAGSVMVGSSTAAVYLRVNQSPSPTCSSNCGTSPSVAGSNVSGIVTMGASGVPASGFVITFAGSWPGVAPSCIVQSALASMVVGKMPIAVVTTTTTITVTTNGTAPATSDKYQYICVGVG